MLDGRVTAKEEGRPPLLVVVMGVSGSGKSTLGAALAARCGFRFLDADDFHSPAAIELMRGGQPLDETWRQPWIGRIQARLREEAAQGHDCVLAFSGLRQAHREALRDCGSRTLFLYLCGDEELIGQRLEEREGHFMPASLLASQFRTLESVAEEADVLKLSVALPLDQLVEEALGLLRRAGCSACA